MDDDRVAVIGVGCRFPGAENISEYWRLLKNGENHVTDIPLERFNAAAFCAPDCTEAERISMTRAGLVHSYDMWDNQLYGINDIEAERIESQQRFVLDCTFMALEEAGITLKMVNGSNTGVFIGSMSTDTKDSISHDAEDLTNYSTTSSATSIIASRVAYTFNLLGTAMTLDSGYSSDMAAIYTAAQALLAGDVDMAVCGGTNAILDPTPFIAMYKSAQCGQGTTSITTRGEGCGVILIKTLSKALADGNKIWATLTTSCSHTGSTPISFSSPSTCHMIPLWKSAYTKAKVDPKMIQYIETDGFLTKIHESDDSELSALKEFFGNEENVENHEKNDDPSSQLKEIPIKIGTVKHNIGHLEGAAGMASLIKILLMMKYEEFVPTLVEPDIVSAAEGFSFDVPTTIQPWVENSSGQRTASLNCFSFSGTNLHVIVLQEKNMYGERKTEDDTALDRHIFIQSAFCTSSLVAGLQHTFDNLNDDINLRDLSYTSIMRRNHFSIREAFTVSSVSKLKEALKASLDTIRSKEDINLFHASSRKNIIFVFCGVGTVWLGMGQQLMQYSPVFLRFVEKVDVILKPKTGWSIKEMMESKSDQIVNDPFVGHIAIFTVQVALFHVWEHLGIKPDVIVGQSVGEVAAAYASGVLSLETAVEVIYQRSLALKDKRSGKMLVVSKCSANITEEFCKQVTTGKVTIAVYSSPVQCVVSGDESAIEEIKGMVAKENEKTESDFIIHRELQAKCAYHSFHVHDKGDEIAANLEGIQGLKQRYRIISSVTARDANESQYGDAAYWKENVCAPVKFHQALVQAIAPSSFNIFLEIGPKPILKYVRPEILGEKDGIDIPSMNVIGGPTTIQYAICALYKHGLNPVWSEISPQNGNLTELPQYQFTRIRVLHEALKWMFMKRNIDDSFNVHRFIRRLADYEPKFTLVFPQMHSSDLSFRESLTISTLFLVEIGFEVGRQMFISQFHELEVSAELHKSVTLDKANGKDLVIDVDKNDKSKEDNGPAIRFTVRIGEVIAHGMVTHLQHENFREFVNIENIKKECTIDFPSSKIPNELTRLGFASENFVKVNIDEEQKLTSCLCRVSLPDEISSTLLGTAVHPSVLSGLLKLPEILLNDGVEGCMISATEVSSVQLRCDLRNEMMAYANIVSRSGDQTYFDMMLLSHKGSIILDITGLEVVVTRN